MANTIDETRKRAGWFIDRLVYSSQITKESHQRTTKILTDIEFGVIPLGSVSALLSFHEHFLRFFTGNPPTPSKIVTVLSRAVLFGTIVGFFEVPNIKKEYETAAEGYHKLIKNAEQFKEDDLETATVDEIESKLRALNRKKALLGLQCVSWTASWKHVQEDIKSGKVPLLQVRPMNSLIYPYQPERINMMKEINSKFSQAEHKQRSKYFGHGSNLRSQSRTEKTLHYTTAEHAFWMKHLTPIVGAALPLVFNKLNVTTNGLLSGIVVASAFWGYSHYESVLKSHLSAGSNMEKLWGESEIFLLSVDNKEGNPTSLKKQLDLLTDHADLLKKHSNALSYPWPFTKTIVEGIVNKKLNTK